MDWGEGRYESIAKGLLPAAATVLEIAAPRAGERVLDIGCGTGNGALLAAERGAAVTGVDPSERLLGLARAAAAARGLAATFVRGEAGALPITDGAVDLALSVFGVIFAPDPVAAAAEAARVLAPGGRLVFSAWRPSGALSEVMKARREALACAQEPAAAAPPPFAWHEPKAVEGLFAPHGFSVSWSEHTLAFAAPSPDEFVEADVRNHPMWISARAVLEPRGEWRPLRERVTQLLRSANESPGAFVLRSPYVVMTARRA